VAKRALREARDDNVTDTAAALAYYAFTALPAVLLAGFGLFTVLAGPDAVTTVVDRLGSVLPSQAVSLVRDSLTRAVANQSSGLVMIAVGAALALWTSTGAMTALMRGLNVAYDRTETRGFVRQRATALGMLAFAVVAFLLSFGLLVLGPHLSGWVGRAVGLETAVSWIWWAAQWPVLVAALLLAFAGILYLGPDVEQRRWTFVTPGSFVTTVVWLVASGGFAVYVALFGSYDKAWGSISAVIVTLVWFWLSAVAILLGAEVNAELERSRELREGLPASDTLLAPPKGS
jgi:membrane protein